jgi:hypothetical protein
MRYKFAAVFLVGAIGGLSLAALFLACNTWPRHGHLRSYVGSLAGRAEPGGGALAATPADTGPTDALEAKFQAYSDRADDLQKLIAVLIGLSSLYAVVLGLSSYASAQNAQQALQKMEADAKDSFKTLETLRDEWKKNQIQVGKDITYGRRLAIGSASIGLAIQGVYLDDARAAIEALVGLRPDHPADRYLNLYIGRLHKALKKYAFAEAAMTVFLEELKQTKDGEKLNFFDAYFNRACYRSLQWSTASGQDQTALQAGILGDLAESSKAALELGQYTKDAFLELVKDEKDFDNVRSLDWFKPWIKP